MDLQKRLHHERSEYKFYKHSNLCLIIFNKGYTALLAGMDFKISRGNNDLYIIQTIFHIVYLSFWMLISTEFEGIFIK